MLRRIAAIALLAAVCLLPRAHALAWQANDTPTSTAVVPTVTPTLAPAPTPTPTTPTSRVLLRLAQAAVRRANTSHFVSTINLTSHQTGFGATLTAVGNVQQQPYQLQAHVDGTDRSSSGIIRVHLMLVRIRAQGWVRSAGGAWQRGSVGHTLSVIPSDPYGSFPSLRSSGG